MTAGTTLVSDGVATPFYSPIFLRQGEAATFAIDVTHVSGAATLVVAVEGKNFNETSFTTLGTFANVVGTGLATKDITGLKEQLRFVFSFSVGTGAGDFMTLGSASQVWRP